jgi:hypothetical protein
MWFKLVPLRAGVGLAIVAGGIFPLIGVLGYKGLFGLALRARA